MQVRQRKESATLNGPSKIYFITLKMGILHTHANTQKQPSTLAVNDMWLVALAISYDMQHHTHASSAPHTHIQLDTPNMMLV